MENRVKTSQLVFKVTKVCRKYQTTGLEEDQIKLQEECLFGEINGRTIYATVRLSKYITESEVSSEFYATQLQ